MSRLASLYVFLLIAGACAPTRIITPLQRGSTQVGLNAGGPLIRFRGKVIPIPFSSLYAAHGWTNTTSIYGGLHLTSLVYKTFQLDAGLAHRFYQSPNTHLQLIGGGSLMSAVALTNGATRVFPITHLHAVYIPSSSLKLYGGAAVWWDFYQSIRQSQTTYRWASPAFYTGIQWAQASPWTFTLEYKLLNPFVPNDKTVVEYVHWSHYGAQGLYLSVTYQLPAPKKKSIQ